MSAGYKPQIMKIAAICSDDLAPFFRLLGVDEVYTVEKEDLTKLRSYVRKLAERKDLAIVIVQLRLFDKVRDEIALIQKLYPSFVPIPDPRDVGEFDVYEFYRPIIRKYVGFEVTLGE